MNVRRLAHSDADAYVALRREALLDAPLAFGAAPDDDFVSSAAAVEDYLCRDAAALFGAFDGADLTGAVGLYRDRHRKSAHKAHLWGMFVRGAHRRRGAARALVDAAIAHARSLDGVTRIDLAVSSDAAAARSLYIGAGFAAWGTEPDALRDAGRSAAEDHMILVLGGAAESDRVAVIETTNAIFAAMKEKNEAAMRAMVRPDASFVSARIAEQKVLVRSGDEFIRGVVSNPSVLDERIFDAVVESDGRLASLRAPYDFHIDGRFSHRGTDVFVFLRDGGWVLISAAYTIE